MASVWNQFEVFNIVGKEGFDCEEERGFCTTKAYSF